MDFRAVFIVCLCIPALALLVGSVIWFIPIAEYFLDVEDNELPPDWWDGNEG